MLRRGIGGRLGTRLNFRNRILGTWGTSIRARYELTDKKPSEPQLEARGCRAEKRLTRSYLGGTDYGSRRRAYPPGTNDGRWR
jgi:hypothetical protein